MREKGVSQPDEHCLAIARSMYCAHFFRKCGNWNDKFFPREDLPFCEFKCYLYGLRCPSETEMYKLMCE